MACIRKRRGRWVIDFYDQHGKRRWKTLKEETTKKRATEELRAIEEQVGKGAFIPIKEAPLFKSVAKEFIETKKLNLRANTFEVVEGIARNHFTEFDEIQIRKITTARVEKFIRGRQEEPRSLALVGASGRSGALGKYVLDNLVAGEFKGQIHLVNPKYREVAGLTCHARLTELRQAPDLVVVVTPAATVPDLIDDAAAVGARAVLVLSAGFAEVGAAGRQLHEEALARARASGIRLLGPNCLGIMRPDIGLNASYARTPARPGSVALVSQSAAVVAALLDFAATAGFGFSSVVSTGAGSDVEFSEILDFLALDGATHSIILFVEGVHDARSFLSSVRAAASVKPVVVLKVGRHLAGSKAGMSHTGALVGDDASQPPRNEHGDPRQADQVEGDGEAPVIAGAFTAGSECGADDHGSIPKTARRWLTMRMASGLSI